MNNVNYNARAVFDCIDKLLPENWRNIVTNNITDKILFSGKDIVLRMVQAYCLTYSSEQILFISPGKFLRTT